MWTKNFQMFKLNLEKGEEPEIKLPTSTGSSKKQESSRKKNLLLLYWLRQSLWLCGSFLKRWEYQTTLPASWEIRMQVKKQQLEPDMEQWTGSKLGKEYVKAVYCHPVYLTYMQSKYIIQNARLDKAQLESWLLGEMSITSDIQMTPPLWQKVKEESEKAGLKLNIQKTKIMASGPITSWQTDGKQWKQWQTLFSWALKSLQMVTAAMKSKDACSLEEKLWPT